MKSIDKPMCGCGNTSNPNGYCDRITQQKIMVKFWHLELAPQKSL